MSTPIASSSARPMVAGDSASSCLDVETTNWNAVKILAVQQGIPPRLLETIRDAVTAEPTGYPANHDFGLETPFYITAALLDTGRVIFRFRSRQSVPTPSSKVGPADMAGTPRSSSSGAIVSQPALDSADSQPSAQRGPLASGLFRKTGNLSLKHSRSIPVLRRKASVGLASFKLSGTGAGPSAGAFSSSSSSSILATRYPGDARGPVRALPLASSSGFALGSNGESMARTGSTPISGPYANRLGTDYISEGDVLGAVLGLGQAELWADAHAEVQSPQPPNRGSSGPSSYHPSPPPQLQLPQLSSDSLFARSPRLHQLREAQSFESNASDITTRATEDTQMDLDRYPSDLHPFLREESAIASSYNDKFLLFDVMQCYQRPSLMLSPPQSAHSQARKRSVGPASPPVLSEAQFATSAQPASLIEQAQALPTSAAPGDDPRFAVWAVRSDKEDGTFVVSNRLGQTDEEQILEHASPANESSTFTTKRRKRRSPLPFGDRSTANDDTTPSVPPARAASSTKGKAMLLAASAARLVAELTAEIDLDLRRDFFYTYREFMTPADLLELLILRFEWAVSLPGSVEDEARRRIVRVRTYVVIKHWLQNHFEFDFLPDRALRQRLATWLNSVAKDKRVTARPADLNIVNSLRKIVRGLKETYSQSGVGGLLLHDAGRVIDNKTSSTSTLGSSSHDSDPSAGSSASTRSNKESGLTSSASGSSITEDVDLDFNEDQSSLDSPQMRSPPAQHSQRSSGEARGESSDAMLAAAQKASAESVLVSHRHTLAPSSLQQSRSQTSAASSSPFALPHTSNAWSRAVVNTVGRLSKFKRAIGARGMGMDSQPELDSEVEECNDLLFAKGGLDSLLQYFAADQARRQSLAASRMSRIPQQRPLPRTDEADEEEEGLASQASEDSTGQEATPSLAGASTNRSTPASSIDLTVLSDQHASHGHQGAHGLGIGIGHREQDGSDFSTATHAHDALGLDSTRMQPLSSLVRAKAEGEDHLHHAASEQTLRSVSRMPVEQSSQESAPMTRSSVRRGPSVRDSVLSNGAPRIVQIDDIDLSSDEDDFAVRKALRRLPGARDLRQANTIKDLEPHPQLQSGRESVDSMASSMFRYPAAPHRLQMGSSAHGHARGVSVDSALFLPGQLGSMHLAAPPGPPVITTVQSEMLDPDEALQGYELVKGFRLDDIESDDEEPGGVEAALLRLEGIIDEDRQKAKAKRVERMWQRSMARNAKRDALGDSQDSADKRRSQASLRSQGDRTWSSSLTGGSLADIEDDNSNASVHPCDLSVDGSLQKHAKSVANQPQRIRPQASFLDLQDGSSASESGEHEEHSPATVPQGELQQPPAEAPSSSRTLDAAGTVVTPAQRSGANSASRQPVSPTKTPQPVPGLLLSPKAGLAAPLPSHRSFLLSYRTESVARQMCLIEAELLRSVSWDELASPRWRERRYGAEVTDWEAFYRDRVRDRLEAQRQGEVYHERAVEAIVARFNLTSNWVASEIVLTHNIEERAAVICKLIRVAWKCYLQSNFASLAQIIFGLSTPWVQRLRRTWSRVGYFEMRMWRDLNSFVGPRHNFRHLRNAMLQLVESSAGESGPHASSAVPMATESAQSAPARGCIPFFGLFVSDLMQYDAMPTFLDPTSPTMAATTTTLAADGKVRLYPADPNAFADLAPLPPGVQLEPLINVLKFRNVAEVIRQISAFQNAAKNYAAVFEAEKGAYVRCLKLRCLPGELLARLSHSIEP